jgi:hypothetical protein
LAAASIVASKVGGIAKMLTRVAAAGPPMMPVALPITTIVRLAPPFGRWSRALEGAGGAWKDDVTAEAGEDARLDAARVGDVVRRHGAAPLNGAA